jgi:hypothetical protein
MEQDDDNIGVLVTFMNTLVSSSCNPSGAAALLLKLPSATLVRKNDKNSGQSTRAVHRG